MNRHLRILDFALSTLIRNFSRNAAVVVLYSLLVGLLASLLLYVKAHQTEAHRLLRDAPEIVVQKLRAGRHEMIPVGRAESIRAIRGVGDVTPRVWGYSYDPPTRATFTLWGSDSVPREALDPEEGEAGGDEPGGACVVGRGVSDARFLGVGDRLPIRRADGTLFAPRITGIFVSESALLTNDLVVLPSSEIRRVFSIGPDLATDIAVRVHNPNEVDTVARKIQQSWADVRVITRRQMLQTYDAVFDWRGGVWAAVLLGSVFAFAILVWDKGTGLSREEYKAIGVLKAVGWKTREVMELKMWEGVIVSVVSLLAGILLAQVHLLWFNGALFSRVIRGWSVLWPSFDVAPALDAYTTLTFLPLAVVPYVAASLVPSWRAAITDPDSVIRS